MKIYVSSILNNHEMARKLIDKLKDIGHEITFDWTRESKSDSDNYSAIASNEIKGVVESDVVIALLPGGRGSHIEIGSALALNKKVILWSDEPEKYFDIKNTCVFYFHPNVIRLHEYEEIYETF